MLRYLIAQWTVEQFYKQSHPYGQHNTNKWMAKLTKELDRIANHIKSR